MLYNIKVSLVVYVPMKPSCYVIILGHQKKKKSNREKKFIIQKKPIKLFESLLKSLFFSLQLLPSLHVCVYLCTHTHTHTELMDIQVPSW